MLPLHPGSLAAAIEAGASLIAIVLAGAAYTAATWKHSALGVQKEVTETYRQFAEAERRKVLELEERILRLEARVRRLDLERERCAKKQAAAHAEIEQFERIVRLLIGGRASLSSSARQSAEHLLAEINQGREAFAADLFAWEQARSYHAPISPSSLR